MSVLGIFHNESERDYHAILGLYTIMSAAAEDGINEFIKIIYARYDGHLVEPVPPLAIKRKLSFLRKAVKAAPFFQNCASDIMQIIDFYFEDLQFRHDIIHGSRLELPIRDPHYEIIKRPLDRSNPGKGSSERRVDYQELRTRYDELGKASVYLVLTVLKATNDHLDKLTEHKNNLETRLADLAAKSKDKSSDSS